jgi:hypothetical protein
MNKSNSTKVSSNMQRGLLVVCNLTGITTFHWKKKNTGYAKQSNESCKHEIMYFFITKNVNLPSKNNVRSKSFPLQAEYKHLDDFL